MRGLFDTPTLGPCKITLHPYQEEAVAAVGNEFRKGARSTLLSMATGSGKTMVAGMIIRRCLERGKKCLFLAHTSELIEQTADKLDMLGVEPGVEQAGQFARSMFDAQAVVGSVQTMMQPGRLASWPDDYFDYVAVDEGHRSAAMSYKRIMAHFSKARFWIQTATPVRTDGQAIGYTCDTLAYNFSIRDAWKAGKRDGRQYLCDLKIVKPEIGFDPKLLRRNKADLTDRQYDDRLAPMMDIACNKIREHIGDGQAVQFWPTIRAAQLAAHGQKAWYPSEAVWGADPDRQGKIDGYRRGDIRSLCNQNLLVEGWDVPSTSAVILGRSTNSWTMMLQQIGRGLRAGKPFCTILDLFGMTDRFGEEEGCFVQPIDILGDGEAGVFGEFAEIKRIMAELLAREPELTLMNAIEQAEDEHERRVKKKQYAIRLSLAERQVECDEVSYSAMEAYEADSIGPASRPTPQSDFKPATDGQKRFLRVLGFGDEVERWSRGRAGTTISYAKRQREEGKSAVWQRTKLARKGVKMDAAREMSKEEASEAIEGLLGRRAR